MSPRSHIEVVAGILHDEHNRILLGKRPAGSFYPGYWEFPGGKIEPGETPETALRRELQEELGITLTTFTPWITREHTYEHAHVRLHCFRVSHWQGTLHHHVHAQLVWQHPSHLEVTPALPTTLPILKYLQLPDMMGITQASHRGIASQLEALEHALKSGLRLIQVREAFLPPVAREAFFRQVQTLAQPYSAIVILNGSVDEALAWEAQGLHLNRAALLQCQTRPPFEWVGASCHNRTELEAAAKLEVDYALFGPVLPTASHPGEPGIGWKVFTHHIREQPFPVFALGGLKPEHIPTVKQFGGQGIAAIRAAWQHDSF